MDRYTDAYAIYPDLKEVDFFGHSNGTYIAASALQQYKALRLRNVLFAGSVVPSHFNWNRIVETGQVTAVRNIVADTDWVVALFPQVFELISRTLLGSSEPQPGPFDIGAAGFRGFVKAGTSGPVQDIRFLAGQHSTAVDFTGPASVSSPKIDAIARFLADGDDTGLKVFKTSEGQPGWLATLSNMAWIVWLLLAAVIFVGGRLAARRGIIWLGAYGSVLLAILWTV